jgi:acetyl-CoA carboxylase carboxyltransferase component
MGPEAAVKIIYRREIAQASDPERRARELANEYAAQLANPFIAAARGYIDDVIEPQHTRRALIKALMMTRNKRVSTPARKHGNIPL